MKKFYALPAALLLVVMLLISGCGENDCTECCDEKTVDYSFFSSSALPSDFEQFNGTLSPVTTLYYYYLPGTPARVQFFIGKTNTTVCTNEHLSIGYVAGTTDSIFDRPVKIFGEVYWSIFSDEVIVFNNVPPTGTDIIGNLTDVGLKQAFPEGAATIDVYITVEFESLGSFDLDAAWFQSHFRELRVVYTHKEF